MYGTLRHRLLLDYAVRDLLKGKRPPQPILRQILRIGAYQILFLERVPLYAAVDETVSLAHTALGKGAAGFINALLRKIADKSLNDIKLPDCDRNPAQYLSIRYSHPGWMVDKFLEQFGTSQTEGLLKINNEPAPTTLRVNTLKTSRADVLEWIRKNHPAVKVSIGRLSPQALIIKNIPITSGWLPIKRGWVYVQDEAAQLIGYFAQPETGMWIIDYCSAPGGKLTHIAELTQNSAELFALDVNKERLKKVRENCQRLGIKRVRIEEISPQILSELKKRPADIVLVDVPCSGLGTIRRHPDIKWKRSEKGIAKLPQLQMEILESAAALVRTGGRLICSTCTLLGEENEDIVKNFLRRHPEFVIEKPTGVFPVAAQSLFTPEGFLFTFPPQTGTDGFFAARLRKATNTR